MKAANRISQRIAFSFLFFGAALILMLGLGLLIALKSFETNMLDDILHTELKEFRRQVESAQVLGFPRSRTTTFIYVTPLDEITNMPEHLRNLTQGTHDVEYNDRDYRVLVEHLGDTRYTVQLDETSVLEHQRNIAHLVLLCSIIALTVAFVVGWNVAHRVVQPITQLVNQIMAFKNQPGESLDLSKFGDDEIGVLAHELQHYHEQLQRLLNREKEFASNVSHELRTPVTSISLAAEVLATKPDLSAIELGRIQRIQRAVGEISELIETFLVLAQIKNESAKHHSVNEMAPIVRKVIEQQRVWLGDKPIEVIIEEKGHLQVLAPSGILSVLVANLVRNAFRYTKRGTVTVSLTSNHLTVADTGVGIAASAQHEIFNSYAKNNLRDTERIKLGLSIVQRICERYGWTVSVESEEGQGSRFTVLFSSD